MRMERKYLFSLSILLALGLVLAGCKPANVNTKTMDGTLDEPFSPDETMDGCGVMVKNGSVSTIFPHIRHTREVQSKYNAKTGDLWLTSSAMEGTGVRVEWLYQIRFGDNDIAYIAFSVEPYDLQQQLCQRLGYSIDGEKITLWDGAREIATVTNTVTDMGGFDNEQPVWIGEQIGFDLSGSAPRLLVTPGVKFTTGLVLTYDDMPTLSAPLSIADDGTVSIGDLEKN